MWKDSLLYPSYRWFLGLIALEVLSFVGSVFPEYSMRVAVCIAVVVFVLALKDIRYGIIALIAELTIGSQGYLFAIPYEGFTISLRLALFCVVFCAAIIHSIRTRTFPLRKSFFFPYLIIWCVVIGYGVVNALWLGRPPKQIFFDVNAWLFLGMAFPFAQSIRTRADFAYVIQYFFWTLYFLAAKTLLLAFLFSHPAAFESVAPHMYRWLRDIRVAEIFRFDSGFARVFMQSQIMAVFGFCVLYVVMLRTRFRSSFRFLTLLGLMMLTIILSYSRTFWLVSTVVVVPLTLYMIWSDRKVWKRYIVRLMQCAGLAAVACGIVVAIVRVPLPGESGGAQGGLLTERVSNTTSEAAVVTRSQQLQPLVQAALRKPVFGSGFGSTVTYTSEDPRIRAQYPSGQYTTYAFEWAYLDLWYKVGIVGLVCILGIIVLCMRKLVALYQRARDPYTLGMIASLLALLGIHVFTPYINHPLGLVWILLGVSYIQVHQQTTT